MFLKHLETWFFIRQAWPGKGGSILGYQSLLRIETCIRIKHEDSTVVFNSQSCFQNYKRVILTEWTATMIKGLFVYWSSVTFLVGNNERVGLKEHEGIRSNTCHLKNKWDALKSEMLNTHKKIELDIGTRRIKQHWWTWEVPLTVALGVVSSNFRRFWAGFQERFQEQVLEGVAGCRKVSGRSSTGPLSLFGEVRCWGHHCFS